MDFNYFKNYESYRKVYTINLNSETIKIEVEDEERKEIEEGIMEIFSTEPKKRRFY